MAIAVFEALNWLVHSHARFEQQPTPDMVTPMHGNNCTSAIRVPQEMVAAFNADNRESQF